MIDGQLDVGKACEAPWRGLALLRGLLQGVRHNEAATALHEDHDDPAHLRVVLASGTADADESLASKGRGDEHHSLGLLRVETLSFRLPPIQGYGASVRRAQ